MVINSDLWELKLSNTSVCPGLILGRFYSSKLLFITTSYSGSSNDRNVKIDVVTDEDVKRPDLAGYEILDYREK